MNYRLPSLTLFSIVLSVLFAGFFWQGFAHLDIQIAEHFKIGGSPYMTHLQAEVLSELFSSPLILVVIVLSGLLVFAFRTTEVPYQYDRAAQITFWSVLITTLCTIAFKILLGRYRPEAYFESQLYGFSWINFSHLNHSSPSGHTVRAFSILLALTTFTRGKAWLSIAIIVASFVAVSRLVLLQHYFSDVLFGAYLSIMCFIWIRYYIDRRLALQKHT